MLNFIKLVTPMSQNLWNALIMQDMLFILSISEQELKIQRTILDQFPVLTKTLIHQAYLKLCERKPGDTKCPDKCKLC